MIDQRPEGVYCAWEPIEGVTASLLRIERVNGDGGVTTIRATREEALRIYLAIMAAPR